MAAALKGSAIDKKFYDEHRNKVVEYIAEHDDERSGQVSDRAAR